MKAKGGIPGQYRPVKLTKAKLYHVTGGLNEATDVAGKRSRFPLTT